MEHVYKLRKGFPYWNQILDCDCYRQLWLRRSSPTQGYSSRNFKYILRENEILGILKPIYTEKKIEELLELPRGGSERGSITPMKSIRRKSKQLLSICVDSLLISIQIANKNKGWLCIQFSNSAHGGQETIIYWVFSIRVTV